MVKLDYYKTFIKVAETKSMTKAAEELFVSQPAVTQTIKNLESDLGGPLFLRNNRAMELTGEGQILYERIKAAFGLIETAEAEFSQYSSLKKGEVRIGASTMITKILLVDKIVEFKEKYPEIKVTIENGITANSIIALKRGLLDIGIFGKITATENTSLKIEPLTSIGFCYIYNPNVFKINSMEDLERHPFILQKEKSSTRDAINTFFQQKSLKPNIAIETVSNELIIEMVENGLGIACVYEALVQENDNLKKLVMDEMPKEVKICIAAHETNMQTAAARAFLELLKEDE